MDIDTTDRETRLWAQPGDRLVISGHSLGEHDRDAEVIEALGEKSTPPFRVRWQDDGRVSEIFPGADAHVEHFATTQKTGGEKERTQ